MKGDEWTVYACRLLKHRKSSTRQEDVESGKRRKTNIREAQLCPVKIRITKVSSSETVCIEPFGLNPAIHTHSIDDCDMFKKSQALRDLITEEASKSYWPPDITTSVKELAKTILGEGSGVDYLKTKDVANIQQVICGPINTHLIGSDNLETNTIEAIKILLKDQYQVQEIYSSTLVSSASTSSITLPKQGFVFATANQLDKLTRHGWLTLINSTHKTNKWDWRLFTLYVRDAIGCWCVGGHFFVDGEDSNILAKALKII
jgi:hypothetical protein